MNEILLKCVHYNYELFSKIINAYFSFCRSQTHSLSQQFCSNWHVAFCPVPASYVATVVRTGRLMHSASGGTAILSPDVKWAKTTGSVTPELLVVATYNYVLQWNLSYNGHLS